MRRWSWLAALIPTLGACQGAPLDGADASADASSDGGASADAQAPETWSADVISRLDPTLTIAATDDTLSVSGVTAAVVSAELPGEALVVWETTTDVRARAWTAAAGWASADEMIDPPGLGASQTVTALVRTGSGGYSLATSGLVFNNAASGTGISVLDRGPDGQWGPPISLGTGDTGWWQDPHPPRVWLARDDVGLVALWQAVSLVPGGIVQSASRTDGVWTTGTDAAPGTLADVLPTPDGVRAIVNPFPGDGNVEGMGVWRRVAGGGGWALDGRGPDSTPLTTADQATFQPPATVRVLRGKLGPQDGDPGELWCSEIGGDGSASPDVLVNRFAGESRVFADAVVTLTSGQLLAAYGVNGVQGFQLREVDGTWRAPWSLPAGIPDGAVVMTPDGAGWLLDSTSTGAPQWGWQLHLRRLTADGRHGPDRIVAEGIGRGNGTDADLLIQQALIAVEDRALVLTLQMAGGAGWLKAGWYRPE